MRYRVLLSLAALIAIAGFGALTPALSADKITFHTLDGDSLKGDLIGVYNGVVYIGTGRGRTSFLAYDALTEESRKPVNEWFSNWAKNLVHGQEKVDASDSKLSQFLADNLVKWEDGKLVDYDFGNRREPEFYAFYYSAHWCGPCRRFTPELRAFYDAVRSLGQDEFELIFVSSDTSAKMMEQYMKEEAMPWPAVKYKKRSNSIISKYEGNGIPCLVVTDKHGNLLAHSYRGDEYLGPSVPKDQLAWLLSFTKAVKQRAESTTQPNTD